MTRRRAIFFEILKRLPFGIGCVALVGTCIQNLIRGFLKEAIVSLILAHLVLGVVKGVGG